MKRYVLILIFSLVAWQGFAQNKTYEYDDVQRVTKAHYWEGTVKKFTVSYTYDEVGNRLTRVVEVFCDSMYSIVSGNWTTNTTWSCNRQPTITDDVTISTGHTVTIPAGQTGFVKNLILNGNLVNSQLLKFKSL
jgi:hypothetical protein